MKLSSAVLIVVAVAGSASQAYAECNFDKPKGACTATLRLLKSGGTKPSFSAEVEITSSAGSCSKVEYFVNSTPYTAIIRSNGSEHESLFGTSPIRKSDIEISKCIAYEGDSQASASQDASASGTLSGTWIYSAGTDGSNVSSTMNLADSGGRISGSGLDTMTNTYSGQPVTSRWKLSIQGQLKGKSGTLTIVSKATEPPVSSRTNRWKFEVEDGVLKLSNGAIYQKSN